MKTLEIAPGSILQRTYLRERIKRMNINGKFLEVGSGTGYNSNLLLSNGLTGLGFDLNPNSCKVNSQLNGHYISKGKYLIRNEDFLNSKIEVKYDVIFSCMVIEHLNEKDVKRYFSKCFDILSENGILITLVPSSMKHWGIEDEIAGHFKRYSFECFEKLADQFSFSISKCDGLTYPTSNIIFPISNFLVKRTESKKLELSKQEQTINSSNRKVIMKTDFPLFFKPFFNRFTMYPFHLLQKAFRKNPSSMVIYCEMKKLHNNLQ
jgi:SAM-dependent methyltransferase